MADFGSINYSQAVANPMDAYTKGLTHGIAQREMNLQESLARQKLAEAQRAAQEKAALEQEKQQAISAFISKPEKTADDYEAFALKWATPKAQEEAIAAARARMSAQDVENKVNYGGEILAYLRNEKPDMAIKRLDELASAADNAKNTKASNEYRRMKEMVQDNPEAVADMLAFGLVQYPGGKDKLQSVLDMEKAKREAALQPSTLATAEAGAREAEAKAGSAEVAAVYAPAMAATALTKAQEEARSLTSAANIKKLEETWSEGNLQKKLTTDLEKTQAETKKALAETAKTDAERSALLKKLADMKSGVIPAEDRPTWESKYREEYRTATKDFQAIRDSYSRLLASQDNAVGDLNMIFGYMKMLDPNSVVREGEFETARKTAGIPDRIWNTYEKIRTGERLTPKQRDEFRSQSDDLYKMALSGEKKVRDGLSRIAKKQNLDVDNIFYEPGGASIPAAPSGASNRAAADAILRGGR